jgi:hypothetical protein
VKGQARVQDFAYRPDEFGTASSFWNRLPFKGLLFQALVLASKPLKLGFILVELPLLFLGPLILSHELVAYQSAGKESDRPADQGTGRSVAHCAAYNSSRSRS